MFKKMLIINILLSFTTLLFAQVNYTQLVNPFVGSAEHGHTFPGATVPFGMVQLSPDTGVEGWDWCSGYHATDSSIMGFSHTHLSGTGVGDYGDILFMPFVGEDKFVPGSKENPDEGYRSRFSHSNEFAGPGYYSVFLDDYNIKAELTSSKRVGFHKYNFEQSGTGKILIDLAHGIQDASIETFINFIDKNTVTGYRTSSGWANRHTIYFYAEFSKEITGHRIQNGSKVSNDQSAKGQFIKSAISFDMTKGKELLVKVGISHVSIEGAKKNLKSEINDWDFDEVRNNAEKNWNDYLSRIEVEGGTKDQRVTYYTALYHAFIAPNIFNDVDKKYMGMDGEVKIAEDFNMYTIFSLWDTFRALHPLLTIVDEKLTADLIKSMIAKYNERGSLPVWELAGNETYTMIGYHSIPVIVDAYMKGIRDFDIENAYKAMISSSLEDRKGLEYYKKMGFIPMDKEHDAVSSTLEYAYDDWCIAQMAYDLGRTEDYEYYMRRAKNYLNVFNPKTDFMQGRYNSGEWSKDFDPIAPSYLGAGEFTEGNSWQYSWFVPQDIEGLIELFGGDKKFNSKLDDLFSVQTDIEKYKMPSDVTGLIGQYAQGNEPSHHIAYLYNYCGYPYKTQAILRKIMDGFFHSGRNGLCGNEDCGQMSAWYAFSAIGFYPVTPGSNDYVIGSPLFDKVTIHLENGKDFVLSSENNSSQNKYIQSIQLNGKDYSKLFFSHADVKNGSNLKLNMDSIPNNNLGVEKSSRPKSSIDKKFTSIKYDKYFMPVIKPHRSLFAKSIEIEIEKFNDNTEIYYTIDGTDPNKESIKYIGPILFDNSFKIKAAVFGNELNQSEIIEKDFKKSIVHEEENPYFKNNSIIYPYVVENENYFKNYSGGGKNALIDGNFGSTDFRDPYWQGYESNDCDIIIDLGKVDNINSISVNFMENQGSWIFLPQEVKIAFSVDGENYSEFEVIFKKDVEENYKSSIKTFSKQFNQQEVRYVHFVADNIEFCPDYHKGAGGKAFMFIDEIVIEK